MSRFISHAKRLAAEFRAGGLALVGAIVLIISLLIWFGAVSLYMILDVFALHREERKPVARPAWEDCQ